MRVTLCIFLLSAICLAQEHARIRRVYLTGSKYNAIHSGRKMLHNFTCMEAVTDAAEADAIIDLEVGTVSPIRHLPQPAPTGFVTCNFGGRYVSCSEIGGPTIVTSCTGRGAHVSCSSYSYDPGAMVSAVHDSVAEGYQALQRKLTTHAYVTDKESQALIWDYDEGVPQKGVSAWHSQWWEQLNAFVGCGKTKLHYEKQ